MSESQLVNQSKEFENKKPYNLGALEAEQYGRIIERIVRARNLREQPRDEFDGMSYEQAYLSNKRAAFSYLQPKKNDDEVRINTGTTEKKIELVLNELLALNLEAEVRAFDKEDNLLQDVSDIFTDIVLRTEQIEQAKDRDIYFYRELLTQPSLFVEELWIEQKLKNGNGRAKKGFSRKSRCERRMLQGVQIYLGDVFLPDIRFNEQPYLIKYARMNYDEAKSVFGNYQNFKDSVKPGVYSTLGTPPSTLYRKGSLQYDEVEAFWYMSYPNDELQIIVNGIPMLEVGAKYTDEYGELGGYHITMVGVSPYGWDFAYSKPLTQSAKTLQALDNETIRNLIRKFRQALEPPVGVPSGKMWSRDIWNPGTITQGIRKNDFEKLIDHAGVTRSEMAMFDLIEKKVNEFIGSSQQDPLEGKTQVTATELTLAQKQAIKMLGLSVLAAMRLKNRLALLRVKNVLLNYTEPVGKEFDPIDKKVKDVYARFTLEGADIEGQEGTRVVQMMDRSLSEEEKMSVFKAEEKGRKQGRLFEFKGVNINALRNLELYFYVNVVAKERESTQLNKLMFNEMMTQGIGISKITGRPMKPNKIIQKFERIWKEKDLFEKEAPAMATGLPVAGGQGEEMTANGSPMARMVKGVMMKEGMQGMVPEM